MAHSAPASPVDHVGGSSGTVFAWDLRLQQQPILLSGVSLNETTQTISESEVWEVQYDSYTHSSNINSAPSTRILPIMMCSEDGILAVLEQGEEPIELLAENCAINAFDIDPQNPSDVICGLEWESIGILTRSRETVARY
ncbi:putative Nuclear pore complex protein NUP43 [Cocos nucifera]|uniref:Putative Nuclear pore complex protein NUP43 n=1 Tax=Cocos nucifera TaxID=13894 RepID=A0A8K0IVL7_COCNU|nr:putative Nuclear pore complex protein NUP43 [Cocos nucifera]